MSTVPLQRALPIVGSALGRKMGVRVEVSGQRAFTDGQCIHLPDLDLRSPEQQQMLWGYLAHEAAHIRYTEFGLDYQGSILRRRLTNLLEDIRIEKAINSAYPGTVFSLAEVVRQLMARGRLCAPRNSDSPVNVLHDAMLLMLRYQVLNQNVLAEESVKARGVLQACFPQAVLDELEPLLTEVADLGSTREALDLADRIIALLRRKHSDEKSKQPVAGAIDTVLSSTDDDWPQDLFQTVAATLESWRGDQPDSCSAVTTTPEAEPADVLPDSREEARVLLDKVERESVQLKARLTGLLQARGMARCRTGRRGTRINVRHLYRAGLSDGRLFRHRSEAITIDAAIHISLDISSSMRTRMELAREAVLALVCALNAVSGVSVSVSAWPGLNQKSVFRIRVNERSALATAEDLASLRCHGTTPMATGFWHGVHQVCQSSAGRRLIVVVTDGVPNDDHECPTTELATRCAQSGIDAVGLGIRTVLPETLFSNRLTISRIGELKKSLFELTRQWLTG